MRTTKLTLIILVTLLGARLARAGACGPLFVARAAGEKLARNGLVMIEAGGSDALIEVLKKARFVGAGPPVAARVVRVEWIKERWEMQVLIAPVTALPAEAQVHLEVEDPSTNEDLARFVFATSADDGEAPRWKAAPKLGARKIEPSNKGDDVDVYRVRVALEAPSFVAATVGDKVAIYRMRNGEIEVGRDGCHSMLSPRGKVSVTLAAVAADGTEIPAPGKPLRMKF